MGTWTWFFFSSLDLWSWGKLAGHVLPVDRINLDRCLGQVMIKRNCIVRSVLVGTIQWSWVTCVRFRLVTVAKITFALLLVVEKQNPLFPYICSSSWQTPEPKSTSLFPCACFRRQRSSATAIASTQLRRRLLLPHIGDLILRAQF